MLFPGNIWPCSGCTFLLGSILLGIRFTFIGLVYARAIDKIVKPASDSKTGHGSNSAATTVWG
jgi:hypothetical protein